MDKYFKMLHPNRYQFSIKEREKEFKEFLKICDKDGQTNKRIQTMA